MWFIKSKKSKWDADETIQHLAAKVIALEKENAALKRELADLRFEAESNPNYECRRPKYMKSKEEY